MRTAFFSGTAAANAAVVVPVRHQIGTRIVLDMLAWSYNAAPTAGRIRAIGDQSGRGIDLDISAAGVGSLPSGEYGLPFEDNEDVTVTLDAAGAAVVGKVSIVVCWKDSQKWQTADS